MNFYCFVSYEKEGISREMMKIMSIQEFAKVEKMRGLEVLVGDSIRKTLQNAKNEGLKGQITIDIKVKTDSKTPSTDYKGVYNGSINLDIDKGITEKELDSLGDKVFEDIK